MIIINTQDVNAGHCRGEEVGIRCLYFPHLRQITLSDGKHTPCYCLTWWLSSDDKNDDEGWSEGVTRGLTLLPTWTYFYESLLDNVSKWRVTRGNPCTYPISCLPGRLRTPVNFQKRVEVPFPLPPKNRTSCF